MDDLLDLVADELEADPVLSDSDADSVRYLANPRAWVRERLGEHLWSKQVQIAESVRDNRQTAVRSCHGVGKSFMASRLASWWIDSHPPGSARIVTTAPTGPQVQAILWTEINTAAEKARARGEPFPGRVNETDWKIGRKLVGIGRKPADHDTNAFQGIHAKYVLVVLDEACGINKQFWTAAKSMATGHFCRILAIGNPDDPGSYFAEICDTPDWPTIEISAASSPNFTGEPVPEALREVLVSHAYVEEMIREYGEESPTVLSKVHGKFPTDAKDGVVRLSKLRACSRPRDKEYTPEQLLPVELGVDPAAGGDQAVIRERRGVMVGREWGTHTQDSEELVDLIVDAINETGATAVKVDVIGVGWGVVGSLRRRAKEGRHFATVIPVNVGEASTNPKRFLRLRSQIWWEVGRGLTEDCVWDMSELDEPDRERLVSQLTAPKYELDAARRIVVEKKEDTKKRLGRSPDNADALLLAFYSGAGQGQAYLLAMKQAAADKGVEVPSTSRDWRDRIPPKTTSPTPRGGRRADDPGPRPVLPQGVIRRRG
jgi:nucleoid DNA-binding protein